LLDHLRGAKGYRLGQELRDIRTLHVSWRQAAEQRAGSDAGVDLGPAKVGQPVQVVESLADQAVGPVFGKRNIACERLPVEFRDFPGDLGAGKSRRRRQRELMGIRPKEIEAEMLPAGLGVLRCHPAEWRQNRPRDHCRGHE
jgi:hypothetical protein